MRAILATKTALSVALSVAAGAPAAETLIPVAPDRHEEFVLERLQSSSDLVVGAVYAAPAPVETPPRFRIRASEALLGASICLRTRSVDGFYRSEFEYRLPATSPDDGIFDFVYPTEHPDRVSDPPGETLAVAAYEGSCAEAGGDILVGHWNSSTGSRPDDVLVVLNTVGAQGVSVFVGDSRAAETCQPVTSVRAHAFDFLCSLPVADQPPGRVPIEIHVNRYSTRDPARTEHLRLPG